MENKYFVCTLQHQKKKTIRKPCHEKLKIKCDSQPLISHIGQTCKHIALYNLLEVQLSPKCTCTSNYVAQHPSPLDFSLTCRGLKFGQYTQLIVHGIHSETA